MKHIFTWKHKNSAGKVIGEIKRFIDSSWRKYDIPCYNKSSDSFLKGIPAAMKQKGYPLFGLESLKNKNFPVIICEGQKCVTALIGLGFQAVTSILGAKSAHNSCWLSLDDFKTIYLMPDNDLVGKEYVRSVCELLSSSVNSNFEFGIIKLPDLPEKGDVCDYLKTIQYLEDWDEFSDLSDHPERDAIRRTLDESLTVCQSKVPDDWVCQWPEPESVEKTLLPVESFSLEFLPDSYQEWVQDVSKRMQCPVDFVAIGIIALTSSIIGAGCSVRPKKEDNWVVIPNLWGVIVGPPSSLKTPALKESLKFIDSLELDAKKEFDSEMQFYEAAKVSFDQKKKALRELMKSDAKKEITKINSNSSEQSGAKDLESRYQELQTPKKPIWKRYRTNDSTVEKMSELLSENPKGLLLFRDELMGLLKSWDKKGHETDRSFYLEAWNGIGSHVSDRIGRGTVVAKNVCVSILGSIQPDRLSRYLFQSINGSDNDGLLQRFQLMVYPDDATNWEYVDCKPDIIANNKIENIIKKLANMDFVWYGAIVGKGSKTPFFHFSGDAQKLFVAWLGDLEKKIRTDDHPIVLEHLAKYRSLMPSLALIFHLIEIASNKSISKCISEQSTIRAIGLCSYLESHARRIYGLITDERKLLASKLSLKIIDNKITDGFTERDIYRKGWHCLTDQQNVHLACQELVDAGWLSRVETQKSFGNKGKTLYYINPKINRQ